MTQPNKPKKPANAGPSDSMAAQALEAIRKEADTLPEDEVVAITIDVPQAVMQTLGVIPNLMQLRPMIEKALPLHPLRALDRLETYALALQQAHILWLPPETAENRVAELLGEATPLRASLLSDAQALAQRKMLDGNAVAAIRAGNGHVDTANDLMALGTLFSANWSAVSGKTVATAEEVKRAAELGLALLDALGARNFSRPSGTDPLGDQRRRAYTLFVRAYDETRRAVAYLRWHEGDADEIMPSLYRGRGGRGAKTKQEDVASPAPAPVNGAPTPVNGAPTG